MRIKMKANVSDGELYALAVAAREKAYAPYSDITVGAALLCASGKVYTGANIENAAYSPTVCAERVAIFGAVNAGEREFLAVAVSGGRRGEEPNEAFSPCGVCRQVMQEFCNKDFKIIFGRGRSATLGELLPHAFDNGDVIK